MSLLADKRKSTTHKFQISPESTVFRKKYDDLQDQLRVLAARDDLLTGNKMEYLCIYKTCACTYGMFAMPSLKAM